MIIYLETSALLKQYVQETGSEEFIAWSSRGKFAGSSLITKAETAAAFAKALRMNVIDAQTLNDAWQEFLNNWRLAAHLDVSENVVSKASVLAFKHGLRGYDSVHLASALLWQEALHESITMTTFDRQLWQAAADSGLLVWPENLA